MKYLIERALDCCFVSMEARAGHLSCHNQGERSALMGLRGRSQTGVTNEGGYPKYLTAPWILSCYTTGEAALLSGFHIRAIGFK